MRQLGPGDEFGGYVIEALAGRGGMGLVYRARQRRPDRIVAIKLIAPELAADPDFRARFELESTTAAQIEHPNVIPVYEVGEDDSVLFIAMRFVQGVDLGVMLRESGKLAPARAARLVSQVAAALDAAHARGLVHRDIKPGNVLVAAGDHVYLTDFGLTKRTADKSGMTKTGMIVGTLDYIAPEQVEGREIDARADVYALGCVTYEMLAGSVPFPRPSDIAKMFAHVNDPPPPLEDVPTPLAGAVARAMAKNPDDRFPSAGDFGRAVLAGAAGRIEDPNHGRSVATGAAAIGAAAHAPAGPAGSPPTELAGAAGTELAGTAGTELAGDRGEAVPSAGAGQPGGAPEHGGTGEPGGAPQDGGAPPPGPVPAPAGRPGRRGWLIAVATVAVAAVIGGAVAVAVGSGGSNPSPKTTLGQKASTTGSTATAVAPAPTSVRIYSPVNASGGLAASVTRRASGSCFTSSLVIVRPDAWRCSVGNSLYDPCFEVDQTKVFCPVSGPWTNTGLLVTVPSGMLSGSSAKNQGTSGLPWALQLADGAQCVPISGASNVIAGQRLNFDCSGSVGLYGNVKRSSSVWMIYTGTPHSVQLALQPIAIAWY